ncbi:hypothetical protein PIB30_009998 [Stylosanthes scabra]|uniref:Ubiquitin-like domain-containing protein n=1 Tax=Stylosanthes scabra TaxID=79078 RepID=A0ABU6U740_9FABA|nr:hypothetical protein [Stylosanthes scabra]
MTDTTLILPDPNPNPNHSSSSSNSRSPFSIQFSSIPAMDANFFRKSFVYNRLRSQPLRLSVLKLDGSTFDIQVEKTATIAELKEAVKVVFSHMPQKGPGKISWPHVWRQFCLCYDGQKLLKDDDFLRNYGIRDGDQLRFIRHVSSYYGARRRKRSKKRVFHFKQQSRSSSQVNSYQPKGHSDDEDDDEEICSDDVATENRKIQLYNNARVHVGKNKITSFVAELFSYNRLSIVRKTRTQSRIFFPAVVAKCLMGSFRKMRRIVSFRRRGHYPWRDIRRQY